MVFSKALISSYLFVALLSLAAVHHAAPTLTSASTIKQARSCINFCFAIDGSTSISSLEFSRELFLAAEISRNVPRSLNPGFAAAQYGISVTPITPLTRSPFELITAIRSTVQQEATGTFITGGLNYCFSELFDIADGDTLCPKSVILLMGDGVENLGTDPAARSGLFEAEGGDVITVAFGTKVNEAALMSIAGEDGFFDARTRGIRSLTRDILRSLGIQVISEIETTRDEETTPEDEATPEDETIVS